MAQKPFFQALQEQGRKYPTLSMITANIRELELRSTKIGLDERITQMKLRSSLFEFEQERRV
jgi:hypothetical protein